MMWQDNSALIDTVLQFLEPYWACPSFKQEVAEFGQALEAVEAMKQRSAVLHEEEIATMAKMEEYLWHQEIWGCLRC